MDDEWASFDQERLNGQSPAVVRAVPDDKLRQEMAGLEAFTPPQHAEEEVIGWTMFDTPSARDDIVVALLPKDKIGKIPHRGLVRIESEEDGRTYLGIVQAGPFAEPDGLRGDAPLVVTVQVRSGQLLMPQFHGRIHIELVGQQSGKAVMPPRFRPLPSSPVFLLNADETRDLLRCDGDMMLGLALGHDDLEVGIPAGRKSVLPRHTGILGTTGAGKSTTVSRMVQQAQKAHMAVILLDVEGEYTEMGRPADNPEMVELLAERGLPPAGVNDTTLYHLAGTETTNVRHPDRRVFAPPFSRLSPYVVCEILNLTDAQQTRYWQAYEQCKALLRELGIYPQRVAGRINKSHERRLERLDEFAEGYPGMTLTALLDVVSAFLHAVERQEGSPKLYATEFQNCADRVMQRVKRSKTDSAISWRALRTRLFRLMRLNVFDSRQSGVQPIDYDKLVHPGAISIIDLSDMEAPDLRNLVIADILHGVEQAQAKMFDMAVSSGVALPRTLVVIEEAHEFLSAERIRRMPNLFQTVSRIAKRGRKRWLGLVCVTQHPQHLPDELLGLLNNYILHRINDSNTISRLRRSIGGIDAGLWERMTALAPGQAVVHFTHFSRAMLLTVDPTQCRLRMAEE